MKKWLLILPWAVVVTTFTDCKERGAACDMGTCWAFEKYDCHVSSHYATSPAGFMCKDGGKKCDWIYDFVQAMNEAHEKRARDSYNSAPHHSISVDNNVSGRN